MHMRKSLGQSEAVVAKPVSTILTAHTERAYEHLGVHDTAENVPEHVVRTEARVHIPPPPVSLSLPLSFSPPDPFPSLSFCPPPFLDLFLSLPLFLSLFLPLSISLFLSLSFSLSLSPSASHDTMFAVAQHHIRAANVRGRATPHPGGDSARPPSALVSTMTPPPALVRVANRGAHTRAHAHAHTRTRAHTHTRAAPRRASPRRARPSFPREADGDVAKHIEWASSLEQHVATVTARAKVMQRSANKAATERAFFSSNALDMAATQVRREMMRTARHIWISRRTNRFEGIHCRHGWP